MKKISCNCKRRGLRVIFALLGAALLTSCTLFPVGEEALPPPIIPREEISYNTMVVELGDLEIHSIFDGFIRASRNEDITLEVPDAVLMESNVSKDDRVEEGDILAVFANENLERQSDDLQWALELARISYRAAERAFEAANEQYEWLLKKSERDIQIAEDLYADAQLLYEHDIISLSELKQSENIYLDTILQIEQSLSLSRANAQNNDAVLRERINLSIAERNLREVQYKIENFVVQAPFSGVITSSHSLDIGETNSSGGVLFTIADDSLLYIIVNMTDRDVSEGHPLLPGVEVNLSVYYTDDGGQQQRLAFDGVVVALTTDQRAAASLNDNAVAIEAYDMPEQLYIGGPRIAVNLQQISRPSTVVIPINALNIAGSYTYVRIFEDGSTRERAVQTGIMSSTEAEIISGLEPGEVIVVR